MDSFDIDKYSGREFYINVETYDVKHFSNEQSFHDVLAYCDKFKLDYNKSLIERLKRLQ